MEVKYETPRLPFPLSRLLTVNLRRLIMLPTYLQPYSVILILLVSMLCFIWRKWSYSITAILALSAATIIGVVPVEKVFSGIDNPAVITVASVMIITNIITRSNVLNLIVNKLDVFTHSQPLHVFSFSLFIAFLSAFMNNIGALGLMLPVGIYTSLKNKRSPSYLLMPMAMASAMGGMVTSIGTPPNLIIANFRAQSVGQPFTMFDFSYVGLSTAIIGVIFIGLIGWRLLPKKSREKVSQELLYTSEIRIPPQSKWIGQPFKQFKKNTKDLIKISGLIRRNRKTALSPTTELKSGDRLIIEVTLNKLQELSHSKDIVIANYISRGSKLDTSQDVLLEAVVPTNSKIQGKNFEDTNFRSLHKFSIIAVSQSSRIKINRIKKLALQAGDMVLIQYKDPNIIDKLPSMGLIPITESTSQINAGFKTFTPLIIFVISIILVALSLMPVQIGFSAAALLMILFDMKSLKYVYKRFDWPIIMLLVGMIPVGEALTQTGGADIIAHFIFGISQHLSVIWTIALLMVITMFLSDFINNAATAIAMSPIAISLAHTMKIPVDPLLMAVAIGASCAFLTPIGHQNNLLVMGPGRYKFFDYMRLGIPLEIIVLVMATPLIYWFWYIK